MANLYESIPKAAFDRVKAVFQAQPNDLEARVLEILQDYPEIGPDRESLAWWIAAIPREITWRAPHEIEDAASMGFFRCGRPKDARLPRAESA